MNYELIIFYPNKDFEIKGTKELTKILIDEGMKHHVLYLDDLEIKSKLETFFNVKNKKYLVFSQNLKGWELVKGKSDFGKYFSTLDIPYNKIEIIKSMDSNCFISLCDKTLIPICNTLNSKVNFFYNTAFASTFGRHSVNPSLESRKYDVLFIGRLGLDKIDFSHKSKLEQRMVNRICKRAFLPSEIQIHDYAFKTFRFLKRIGLSKADFYSVEFMDYVFKLVHKVRSDRRLFVLEELSKIDSNYKICYVTDSTDKVNKGSSSNVTVLPFQPWENIIELMLESKIVINIQPYHLYALHERVSTAMALGCVVATDRNILFEEIFKDGKDILFYDYKKNQLSDLLNKILQNPDKLKLIADSGRDYALKNDMPANRVEEIKFILKLN